MKVLLVEDNAITRKLVRVTLRAESHDVLEAPDARTALELAAQGRPDVILQDLRLPDMDGVTLFGRVRATGYEGPVLALTASSSRDPLLEELRGAPNPPSILLKPFDVDELTERVEELLRGETSPAPTT